MLIENPLSNDLGIPTTELCLLFMCVAIIGIPQNETKQIYVKSTKMEYNLQKINNIYRFRIFFFEISIFFLLNIGYK